MIGKPNIHIYRGSSKELPIIEERETNSPTSRRYNKSISFDKLQKAVLLSNSHEPEIKYAISNNEDNNNSDNTTVVSNSHENLERSAISTISRDSIGRNSVKSFNSNNESKMSMGDESMCKTTKMSNEKFNSLEFAYNKNLVYQSSPR
jgi:hypothetical protein